MNATVFHQDKEAEKKNRAPDHVIDLPTFPQLSSAGWDRWIGASGAFIGMNGFGASGPAGQVYKHFGITADAAVAAAKKLIG